MVDFNKKILNGANGSIKISKNFIISTSIVILLSIGGWAIAKVVEMPDKFVSKQQLYDEVCVLKEEDTKIRIKVDRNVDLVIQSINRLDDRMQKQLDNINTKLDSIKNHQENGVDNN